MNARNGTYAFLSDFTLELHNSVFMYTTGIRVNNQDFIEAGRARYRPNCGLGETILYIENLESSDTISNIRMPPECKRISDRGRSINLKWCARHWTDFRLEEINQKVQQWLPRIPSGKDWEATCSNYDDLVELGYNIFADMNVSDPKFATPSLYKTLMLRLTVFE